MDIFLFSDIQTGMAAGLQMQLSTLEDKTTPVNIHINSQGGSIMEGIAMFQLIKNLPNPTTARITGLAASMATVISAAADKVVMSDGSLYLIHDARFSTGGTSEEMKANAEIAESLTASMTNIYQAKTKLGKRELRAMMAKESRFTAKEALKHGFVDEVVSPMQAVAKFELTNNDMNLKEQIVNFGKSIIEGSPNKENAIVADIAQEEALNTIAENIKNAETPADAITAELVKNEDYLPELDMRKQFEGLVQEFIATTKSPEEMSEEFRTIVREELQDMLKGIKSKAEVHVGGSFEKDQSPMEAEIPQISTDQHTKSLQTAIDAKFKTK